MTCTVERGDDSLWLFCDLIPDLKPVSTLFTTSLQKMGRIFPLEYGLDLVTNSPVISFENGNTQLRAEGPGHQHPPGQVLHVDCL